MMPACTSLVMGKWGFGGEIDDNGADDLVQISNFKTKFLNSFMFISQNSLFFFFFESPFFQRDLILWGILEFGWDSTCVCG